MHKTGVIVVVWVVILWGPLASGETTNSVWNCQSLLDQQTRNELGGKERFFAGQYQLPDEYNRAAEAGKKQLIERWVSDLGGGNNDNAIHAAAYLGIVKAKASGQALRELLAGGKCSGRLRWICTRSLGLTGDRSAIPVLVRLLDNANMETRFYAAVSLAEITGVWQGRDKESWEKWLAGAGAVICDANQCKIEPIGTQEAGTSAARGSSEHLHFSLNDDYGRLVKSEDYAGAPVLIMSGSCWCGGCQQDAEPLRLIAEEYGSRGLRTIRSVAGDNELAALDFQKHYRLGFVQLMDTNRSFEKRYNNDGWTFLMLADAEGKVVYRVNSPHDEDWQKIRKMLDEMVAKGISSNDIVRDGIRYPRAVLQRSGEMEAGKASERFTSIACGENGKLYLVFTVTHSDNSDVMMRTWADGGWSADIPIAVTSADEYDGTVTIDKKGQVWLCWTSNAGGKYDIYIAPLGMSDNSVKGVGVAGSDDDVMHGRMACDNDGRVWATYYKWAKMGRFSRDKEVYLRRLERGKWSSEVRISPADVPEYEDHTEPAIVATSAGVVVAWSWDFHPPNKGYSTYAKSPTIFMRPVSGGMMKLGKASSVSGSHIDVTPTLCFDSNGRIWCAWDSLGGNHLKTLLQHAWDSVGKDNLKTLCVANPVVGRDQPPGGAVAMNKPSPNICSPGFAVAPYGGISLVWGEYDGTKWVLKKAEHGAQATEWSAATVIRSGNDPRYCSACYDPDGKLWVGCSIEGQQGRRATAFNIEPAAGHALTTEPNIGRSDIKAANIRAAARLKELIDREYSYRDLRGVNWEQLFARFTPKMESARTKEEFADIAGSMLVNARDMHLWVKIGSETHNGFKRDIERNYDMKYLAQAVPHWQKRNDNVLTGRFDDGIGYIMIKSWGGTTDDDYAPVFDALKEMAECRGIIIDVRANAGGSEPWAEKVAGCFVDKEVVYAKDISRRSSSPSGWSEVRERVLKPNASGPQYRGKVAVLMGRACMSACEGFLLMMRQVPGCVLVGERSYGASGNPKPHELGNGVTVWVPSWKAMDAKGNYFETQGIMPDIRIAAKRDELKRKDAVLEAALVRLRK